MRIGIACYSTYGGSGVVATELGAALAARGHQVHFISAATPFRLASLEVGENVFFHEVDTVDYPVLSGPLYTIALASKIHQLAIEERLDVVHAHYAIPHGVGAWLGQQTLGGRIRVVTTLHGTDITLVGKAPSFKPVVRFLLERGDAITTVSHWLAEETRREFETERPIEVIYNFIDPTRFRRLDNPALRGRFAKPDEKILLHISNFRPVKRVADVVRVFAKVVERIPCKLLMVGDGPDHACAVSLARKLGVLDRTLFLGKAQRIEEMLGLADLFVFPSEYESFGLAALEAMCAEVPVVCSNGGGLPEVVKQGQTGFLRPVGDVDGMAEDALRLLLDPAFAKALGQRAREDVSRRFHIDNIVPRYEALYRELIAKAPAFEDLAPDDWSRMSSGL